MTIPGYICEICDDEKEELERLLFKFGNARRRAYALKQKGYTRSEIVEILREETGLNARYVRDAYDSIKGLPPHVTFGGLKNQRLREKGKISKEEYRKRRNSIVIARGEKNKKGDLNMRLDLEKMEFRINTGSRWIYPKIFVPQKYLKKYGHLLDGSAPYTVAIKRRNHDRGYDIRITVEVPTEEKEGSRIMALDVNAGHTDFAVMDKRTKKLVAAGRISHHETQFVRSEKRNHLIHKLVDKIGNMAEHFDADVAVGKLNTGKFKSRNRKANRKVKNMPQHKLRRTLKKLRMRGIVVIESSEAYTSKVGRKLSPLLGIDVHKAAAIAFCIKLIDNDLFESMRRNPPGVASDEGDGSLRGRRGAGCGPTAPRQSRHGLAGDDPERARLAGDARYPALSALAESLKTSLAGRIWHVKIC